MPDKNTRNSGNSDGAADGGTSAVADDSVGAAVAIRYNYSRDFYSICAS